MDAVRGVWDSYKIPILLGFLSLVAISISIILLVKSTRTETPIQFSRSDEQTETSTLGSQSANFKAILVDIEGAVLRPGIVSLPGGSRVEDAIVAAGGLAGNADEQYIAQNINRALKVADGMKIYIPEAGEDPTSHNLGTIVATPGSSSQNGAFVSVNLASKDLLDSLPGVGPVTAQKIIDNRPYRTLEDLVAKKAIGPALFDKLKNMLSL
jgi:competence protein ComEA